MSGRSRNSPAIPKPMRAAPLPWIHCACRAGVTRSWPSGGHTRLSAGLLRGLGMSTDDTVHLHQEQLMAQRRLA